MTVKVYNPDEVSIVIGAILIDSGFADDEFVRLEPESDDADDTVGSDGEVSVSRTNDDRATLTIILMQTAEVNKELSAMRTLFKSAPGGAGGIVPFLMRDRNSGLSLYTGENCWIKRAPDVAFARVAGPREWMIRIAKLVRFDAGNNAPIDV